MIHKLLPKKAGRVFCTRNFTLSILIASALAAASCVTTKTTDANGTTTTTTGIDQSAGTQAAVSAAIQIATAAAQAAIQTYLTSAPHARLARNNPAIDAAKRATEAEIRRAQPTLSPLRVHNIVAHAFAEASQTYP